jgi:hypothetical protein
LAPQIEVPPEGAIGLSTGGDVAVPDGITGAVMRSGMILDVGTDVTDQLNQASPAFGNVLMAVGNAVAASQKGLDKSVVDTVTKLNDTKIKVVTQVIQELNDDGLPDPAKTQLVTNEVSVLNYFRPTFNKIDFLNISMDLSVGAFHSQQGVQFTKHQESVSAGGSYTWGFGGWFNLQYASTNQSVQIDNRQDVAWSSGQCLIDLQFGPRGASALPVAAAINIGPQIYVTQGTVAEIKTGNTLTGRSVNLYIEVRKTSGEAMQQGVNITLEAGGLLPSFATGSSTDINGKVKVTLTRSLASASQGFQKFPISILLGSISKQFTVTL